MRHREEGQSTRVVPTFFQWFIAVALAAFAACTNTPGVLDVNLQLISTNCGQTDVFKGLPDSSATTVQVSVYGDGIAAPIVLSALATSRTITLPKIPLGTNRIIVVEVIGQSSTLIARGESVPLTFSASSSIQTVTVFIRPAGAFSFATGADSTNECPTLVTARAAHTATTLGNGKVLIAGGFTLTSATATPVYLSSTEIYDPQTGDVSPGPPMSEPRAYHSATHIPGTSFTLLAGGESATGSGVLALQSADVFNESTNAFTTPLTMTAARSRHMAGIPQPLPGRNGATPQFVLIMGGNDPTGTPLSSVEVFEPLPVPTFNAVGGSVSLPGARSEGVAIPVPGGVLVVGGWDGTSTGATQVTGFVSSDNTTFVPLIGAASFAHPHIYPMVATLSDGSILTVDGLASASSVVNPLQLSNAIDAVAVLADTFMSTTAVTAGIPPIKAAMGGAVALLDGTVLVAGGGLGTGMTYAPTSNSSIFAWNTSTGSPVLKSTPTPGQMNDARVAATYTLLQDGTVLVTGGIGILSGVATLNSLELYQPAYVASAASPYL